MPSIQETLRSALGEDPTIVGLVGDHIYPGEVPDDQDEPPWLYYAVPESSPFDELDGDGNADVTAEVEFHAFAPDYATAKAIIDAVAVVLDTYIGGQISAAFWRGTSEQVEDEGHHHIARYSVWGSVANVFTAAGGRAKITTGADSITLTAGGHVLTLTSEGLYLDGADLTDLSAYARTDEENTFTETQSFSHIHGASGDLHIGAGSGSGSNSVTLHDDIGNSVLDFSRNGGVSVRATLKFIPGNTYDVGVMDGNNSPRNIDAQTRVSSPDVYARLINNTAGVAYTVTCEHGSNNNAGAAGDGAGIRFRNKSSTTAARDQATVESQWADATDASRKGRIVLTAADATTDREVLRGESDGSAPMIGFLGASATTRPDVSGSAGGNAALQSLLTALETLGLITDSST